MTSIDFPLFAVRHQSIGGVEWATYNLVKGLAMAGADLRVEHAEPERLSPEFNEWLIESGVQVARRERPIVARLGSRFAEEQGFAMGARRGSVRVYPNYFLPYVNPVPGLNCVLIHDCQFRVLPENFSTKKRLWLQHCYDRATRNADLVLTISDHERDLLIETYGHSIADRCVTIYNAIDFERFSFGTPDPAIVERAKRRYILSVAHNFVHKNVATVIGAFAEIAASEPELELLLVGSKINEQAAAARDGLPHDIRSRIHVLGFVSEASLGLLYRNAALFVLASRYEGFGMPAVEAVGLGVPAVVSDAAALPEVTRGHAAIVHAYADPATWADAIAVQLGMAHDVGQRDAQAADIRKVFAPETVARRLMAAIDGTMR